MNKAAMLHSGPGRKRLLVTCIFVDKNWELYYYAVSQQPVIVEKFWAMSRISALAILPKKVSFINISVTINCIYVQVYDDLDDCKDIGDTITLMLCPRTS